MLDLSEYDLTKLNNNELTILYQAMQELEAYKNYNRLEYFKPYPFQDKFYTSSRDYNFRFLCAANRIGKSFQKHKKWLNT